MENQNIYTNNAGTLLSFCLFDPPFVSMLGYFFVISSGALTLIIPMYNGNIYIYIYSYRLQDCQYGKMFIIPSDC